MRQMSAIELSEFLATDKTVVKIDVREDRELQHGVIDGAIHIPMQTLPGHLPELEQDKSTAIVLICRSGQRSHQVGQFLEQQGFTNVINLSGGMNAWAKDVDARMTAY